jgi:polysaccharide deacetylase family protein (PEP-CTERM system associated)
MAAAARLGAATMARCPSKGHDRVNALTVDVEEWFQAHALEPAIARASWDDLASRVVPSTERVLALCAQARCRATFFVLGWVARRHPALLRAIAADGHEIACHGLDHRRIDRMTPDELRADLAAARAALEDATGIAVRGYRAPGFSIGAHEFWAYDCLADAGFAYSSSVYPILHDVYGIVRAPRLPFRPRNAPRIVELPLATLAVGPLNLPAAGGGLFRLLPYALSRGAIARLNRVEGRSGVFYVHPWELDAGQPPAAGIGALARWRHGANLARMPNRLALLLRDIAWDRLDRVHAAALAAPRHLPLWAPRPRSRAMAR